MKSSYCKSVEFGTYKCYKETDFHVSVDKCLVEEVNDLNQQGIRTVGCCCGHAKAQGYVQVDPKHCEKMLSMGYEQLPLDKNGFGQWSFKPKTAFVFQTSIVEED